MNAPRRKPVVAAFTFLVGCTTGAFVTFLMMALQTQILPPTSSTDPVLPPSRTLLVPDANTSLSYERSYQAALLTIRCFTTPGCFPSLRCKSGTPPRSIRRRKAWEEQAFCADDLRNDAIVHRECLVYSFGIHDSWEWEEKMARLFGCDVHAFDPTEDHPTDLAPGVTFHKLGLQAAGTDMSETHADEYDAIDPSKLLTLNSIRERLGHSDRTIDVLMLDCEGCEWGVLRNMMCGGHNEEEGNSTTLQQVRQLMVEFHFQKRLGLMRETDILAAAEAIVCLEQKRWVISSIQASASGKQNGEYVRDASKLLHGLTGSFLLNLSMRQVPESELLPSERLEKIASQSIQSFQEERKCEKALGRRQPRALKCPKFQDAEEEARGLIKDFQGNFQRRVRFDKVERIDEQRWVLKTASRRKSS